MKTKILLFLAAFLLLSTTEICAKKRAITFNVMLPNGEKELAKAMKAEPGVQKFKFNKKESTAEVVFEDTETTLENVNAAFKKNGCVAFPIGENCSTKKGGCLNNAPTQMNTLK
ncbi:MAG: hypothetical protein LBN27_06970 [Prevotellaceae bacterium]|nr:hypothetical protein [Prevotellaceae bacterium]